eukprot:jgi/Psemu1/328578/estExt_fgenesh1_pg.C_16210001
MGLIGTMVGKLGVPPSEIAYIKPATQCEAKHQLVERYCDKLGVAHRAIGPIVYYKGFTRAFLEGATESSAELLDRAGAAVDDIATTTTTTTTTTRNNNNNNNNNKRYVIVDGVGYPAVGSICGTDNASVARACGVPLPLSDNDNRNRRRRRVPVPVLLVGKKGVGDAVDSHNLNAAYFGARGVPVLGSVFNRLPTEGYYSLENCKTAVTSYFDKFLPQQSAFGFIPEVPDIAGTREEKSHNNNNDNNKNDNDETAGLDPDSDPELESAERFVEIFADCVDVPSILEAAGRATTRAEAEAAFGGTEAVGVAVGTDATADAAKAAAARSPPPRSAKRRGAQPPITQTRIQLTREQVEAAAKNAGAAGG